MLEKEEHNIIVSDPPVTAPSKEKLAFFSTIRKFSCQQPNSKQICKWAGKVELNQPGWQITMKETQNSHRAKALQPNPTNQCLYGTAHMSYSSCNCSKIPTKIQLWTGINRPIASVPWQKWHWDIKLLLITHQPLIYLLLLSPISYHSICDALFTLFPIQPLKISNIRYNSWLTQNAALRRLQITEPCNRKRRMFIAVLSKYLHLKTVKRFQTTVWSLAVVFSHLFFFFSVPK